METNWISSATLKMVMARQQKDCSVLGLNSDQRGLCKQLQKKTISIPDFVFAFNKIHERAQKCGMQYFSKYATYAPYKIDTRELEEMQSAMADLTERNELQAEAYLLRSGTLGLEQHIWELRWHFLLDRAAELGYFWNSETKKFV